MTTTRKTAIAAAILALVAAVAITTWWAIGRDAETRTSGTCDNGLYELTAEPDDRGLEVAFELQSASPGESWDVRLEQAGSVLIEGERLTDEDGELDLDVTVAESDGTSFAVEAVGPDGQTCTAEIRR